MCEGRYLPYEECLLGQGVDGIYHVVITFQTEFVSRLHTISLAENGYLRIWIDLKQTIAQSLHLGLPDGVGSSHQLAVTVAGAHTIGIHQRHAMDSTSQEALGTPTSYTSYAQDDNSGGIEPLHGRGAQKELRALKEFLFSLGHLFE